MSKIRWTGAPAGMGYGFAFNDHLRALEAARKPNLGAAPIAETEPKKSEAEPSDQG